MPTPVVVGLGCLVVAALSLLLPSVPSYDPWSWLVWGREVAHLDLQTSTGPSWKPLPVLLTTPFSVAGSAAPTLWLIVARAGTLAAVAAAVVLAKRVGGSRLAGAAAGVLLLASPWLWAATWTGNSEGILILVVLLAVERHLAGRYGQAFALTVAAGLLRPEAWPFLGVYAVWLLVRDRRRLPWLAAGLAVIPALWLLPELWGSGSLFRAADRAQQVGAGSPGASAQPALEVLKDAVSVPPVLVPIGILLWLVGAVRRRSRPEEVAIPAAIAALAALWILLVAVMTQFGFSGISRYLFAPIGLACVVAAVGYGWAAQELQQATSSHRIRVAVLATLGILAVAIGAARYDGNSQVVKQLGHEDAVLDDLDRAIARSGGERRLFTCGRIYATYQTTPALAWTLGRRLDEIAPGGAPPGTVLRTRLILDQPVDPSPGAWDDVPGRRTLASTRHWNVEAVCRP